MYAERSRVPGGTGNRLLDRLPGGDLDLLLRAAQVVEWRRGREICEQDGPLRDVYFPTTGTASAVVRVEEGKQLEAATIGREGMVGIGALMRLDVSPFTVIAQIPGEAYRIPAGVLAEVMESSDAMDRLLRRYAAYRLRDASQTIACNAVHSVEERICRWLLTAHDRVGRDEFLLTHEFLAELLGIRRQSVTVTAGALQRAGYISYRRGVIRVEDCPGLEEGSCECYEASRSLYDRIVQ